MSYVMLPAKQVYADCADCLHNIQQTRRDLIEHDVQAEVDRRMKRWFFKPSSREEAYRQVKNDDAFMGDFLMQLNNRYAEGTYERLRSLKAAAGLVLDTYKTDHPPVHVSARDARLMNTWRTL